MSIQPLRCARVTSLYQLIQSPAIRIQLTSIVLAMPQVKDRRGVSGGLVLHTCPQQSNHQV